MRPVVFVILLLLVVGWLVSEIPSSATEGSQVETSWRRTADGWERGGWIASARQPAVDVLHPAVLAYLEVLVSVVALAWFPPIVRKRISTRTAVHR